MNSKLTVRLEITEIQKENGELANKSEDICNIFGGYFSSVHTAHSDSEMPDMDD